MKCNETGRPYVLCFFSFSSLTIFRNLGFSEILISDPGYAQGLPQRSKNRGEGQENWDKERNMCGAMVRVWRSADVAACSVVSNPTYCRIFREISCLSPLNLGTLFRFSGLDE